MSNLEANSKAVTVQEIQNAIKQTNSIIATLDKENKRMTFVLSQIQPASKKVA